MSGAHAGHTAGAPQSALIGCVDIDIPPTMAAHHPR
jgi:hypothetical protein